MANTRRIGVQLDFTANMSQAKQAVNEFKQSLTNVMTTLPSNKMTSTAVNSLKEAQVAAQQLDLALTRAFNKNTGNINITKFSQSLKSSGTDVKQLSVSLLNAGKVGQQSFLAMAKALQQVERSAITMNGLVQRLTTTLWNNVRWQVTSAAINTITTSVSDAVNHLKDMDNALNSIRVVSGDTKVEMKGVADEARRMAKDLKTSATEIVKAELIYRQQGDTAEMAAKKAEITTKAANVSFNSSAEQMSEYLTAIWNSYQVPEDQLELFVDKIAKVGAETATSMEEIATAMQKVASVANTTGMSYDQLAAAISTISSVSRQSAETVGTSLKTVLARMESLRAGETAEDGVVLGKVSQDLDKLGISIYDANHELRGTGEVIEELGEKWNTLAKDEQVAIAQTIGSKTQYANFITLMENFDMYKEALKAAAGAQGTLNEQQDIWAESWEAHAQNIQVSAENLYNTLFKTDTFLDAMNFFAGFLDRTSDAVEAVGGLGNILLWVTTIVVSKMTPQIMNGINNVVNGFDIISGRARKREIELQNELTAQLKLIQASQAYTGQQKLEAGFLAENAQQKQKILKIEQNLSDQQKEKLNSLISVKNGWQEIALQEQAAIDKSKEYLKSFNFTKTTGKYKINKDASVGFINQGKQYRNGKTLTKSNLARVATEGIQSVYGGGASYADLADKIGIAKEEVKKLQDATNKKEYFAGLLQKMGIIKPELQNLSSEAKKMIGSFEDKNISFSKISQALNQLQAENGETVLSTEQINKKFAECGIEIDKMPLKIQEYIKGLNGAQFSEETFQAAVTEANNELIKEIISLTDNTEEGIKLKKVLEDLAAGKRNLAKATAEAEEAEKRLNAEIKKMEGFTNFTDGLGRVASATMSATMAWTSFSSALDSFKMGDVEAGISGLLMSIITLTPLLTQIPKTIIAIKTATDAASKSAAMANVWIAVITVALIAIIAIVKAIQANSLKAAAERLKESEEKVTSIKSELEEIDSKINDLTSSNETLTAEQAKQLKILKAQKAEKEGLLEIAEQENVENRKEVVAKATSELDKNELYEKGQYSPEALQLEGKVIVGTKYTTTVTGNKQFDSYEEAQKAAIEAGYSASETTIEVTENYRVLNKAQIEDVYNQVKDLAYTQTDQEFNDIKAQATAQYFATIAASTEDATAAQKIYMSGLQQLFTYHSEFQNTEENVNKLIEESAGNYAQVSGQVNTYYKAIEEMLGTEAAEYWRENTQQQFKNFKSLKQIAEQCGITVDSLDDVDGALEELSKQTGIPKEAIESLYESGAMATFAASGFGSLKSAMDTLNNVSVDATGLVTGLDTLTAQAAQALAAILSLANIEVKFVADTSSQDFKNLSVGARRRLSNKKGGFDPTENENTINRYRSAMRVQFYKNGVLLTDVSNMGDLVKKELDKIWKPTTGKTPPKDESPGGGSTEEKDDDKADKIWWDDYEARKKQIEENFEAGKITQDKYLSDLDAAYNDLISHYDNACEDHKNKILEELNDLRDKNATRNIDLYKSISDAIQTYGYASFNYKGQQRTISSMEEAKKFWDDELAGQTIKDPVTGKPISIYNRENQLDINEIEWDNAKNAADKRLDDLTDNFNRGWVEFQDYWSQKESIYRSGAWDMDTNAIKQFYSKSDIDKNLGREQMQNDFLSWVDRSIQSNQELAEQGKPSDIFDLMQRISDAYTGFIPAWVKDQEFLDKIKEKMKALRENYRQRINDQVGKGELTIDQAELEMRRVNAVSIFGIENYASEAGAQYNKDYEQRKKWRENRLTYGDYIEGTDPARKTEMLYENLRDAEDTFQEVAKLYSPDDDEYVKALQNRFAAIESILEDAKKYIQESADYLEWSKIFGFADGDNEILAAGRTFQKLFTIYGDSLSDMVASGQLTLEKAVEMFKSTAKEQFQSYTSAIKEYADFEREKTEEMINTQKTLLENAVSANQKNYDYQKSLRDSLHDINKELATSLTMYDYLDEETRKLLFNTDDYLELSSKINELQEEGNALTKQYLKDIQGKSIEEQELITQAYEAQMELKSKEYEIAKQDLEVAKKKLALQNVLNERNTRMFLNGQWTWVANQEEVAKAQQDLMDAQYQAESARLELEFTQEQEKLNARIRGLQEQLNILDEDFQYLDDLINGRDRSVVQSFEDLLDSVKGWQKDVIKAREDILDYDVEAEANAKKEKVNSSTAKENSSTKNTTDLANYLQRFGYGTDFWSEKEDKYVGLDQVKRVNESTDYISVILKNGEIVKLAKHATGGIFTVPHLAQFAEDGAEAVIPLSDKYRARGLELWNKAGNILGTLPQFSYKPSFAESGEQTIEQKVYVNIHNEDSTEDFYEINNLV